MKNYIIGQKLNYYGDDTEHKVIDCVCTITEIHDDHVIATEDTTVGRPMKLWIDADTEHLFEEI